MYLQHSGEDDKSLLDCTVNIQVDVIADGEVICSTTKNVMMAFCLYMATHYVFDLTYGKIINHTMTFIQKVILKLNDDVTTPNRVVKLLYDINTHLSK